MKEGLKLGAGALVLLFLSVLVLLMRPFAVLLRERDPPED